MKTFETTDPSFFVRGHLSFMVDRADKWSRPQPGEVPMPDEEVEINGQRHTVIRAQETYGSFGYCPHIIIEVRS